MAMATLGNTGLKVSRLGLGLAEIGEEMTMDDLPQISQVLNTALDSGINFLDTAESYFDREIMVGRAVAHRRDEYILATKCGHTTSGYSDQPWAAQTIENNIDRSLTRLKTDRAVNRLPIPAEVVQEFHRRFDAVGDQWRQLG